MKVIGITALHGHTQQVHFAFQYTCAAPVHVIFTRNGFHLFVTTQLFFLFACDGLLFVYMDEYVAILFEISGQPA